MLHATRLIPIESATPQALAAIFGRYGYRWPPAGPVPAVEVAHLPPTLSDLDPETKKRLFLRLLLPLVVAADNRIRVQRALAERALSSGTAGDMRTLQGLARTYRLAAPVTGTRGRAQLLRRCDSVPIGLVLAQAAKESGWGTSNYARSRNNLFGMRTWHLSDGAQKNARGRITAYVKAYPDLLHSVTDYLYNLNVSPAYREFRAIRAQARTRGEAPDLVELAAALNRYSERGRIYTRRLARLIRENRLDRLPHLWLVFPSVLVPASPAPPRLAPCQGSNTCERSQ